MTKIVAVINKDFPIKLPNRDANFLRDSMAHSHFNMTAFESMQEQQMNTIREQLREIIMRQAAMDAASVGNPNGRATAPSNTKTSTIL